MKANELRLSNLINVGGNTLSTYQTYKPAKVTLAILNEIAGENEERPDAVLSVFQPIPLTEEWLLKFGFTKSKKNFSLGVHQKLFSGVMIFIFDKLLQKWIFSIGKYKDITRVQYVHQLQNLYFALTGEELELK